LLYCLIVWAPFPLGSNRPVIWVVNAIVALLALLLFAVGELTAGQRREFAWRPVVWIGGVMTAWALWMVVQAVPFTPAFLHHPIWRELGADLAGARGAISIDPSATWATVAEFVPVVFLGLVALRLANHERRARFLLDLVVATATVVAVYGLVARALGLEHVVWLDEASETFKGFVTGTFIGRSAAATYFTLGLTASAALLAIELAAPGGSPPRSPARSRRALLYAAAGVVLLVAIFGTGSRGGIIAALLGLAVVALLSARKSHVDTRTLAAAGAAAAAMIILVAVVSGGALAGRLAGGVLDDSRLAVYLDTLRMIAARPLLGQGAGTFADAFPLFNSGDEIGIVWLRAHSTYLQAAAELGLPMFVVVMAGIVGMLGMILRRTLAVASPTPAAIAALGAAAATAIQSTVDFSIQIQANALTLVVLLGAGLGEALAVSPRRAGGDDRAAGPPRADETLQRRSETVTVTLPFRNGPPASAIEAPFGTVAEGRRLYVFGDLHGRLDLLERLRSAITRDRVRMPARETTVVGLGDYIDRGPASKGVIEALSGDFFGCASLYLRGNHEQMLLDFLIDPERTGPVWFRNGAAETFRSYAADAGAMLARAPIDYRAVRDRLVAAMPARHVEFLRGLPTWSEEGGYFFAHAGARPGTPLRLQRDDDLLWIREGFVDRDARFEKMVIHGHTAVDQPYFGRYRINLDTGAYFTDRLSCLVVEGAERRMIGV
jgi:serine/threonine protein phosphatase 1